MAVISNHGGLESLSNSFGVPFHHIPVAGQERKMHEEQILKCLGEYQPDYIVLAKYMRVFTTDFVARFPNKIINIHHSFLPAFIGASPYQQALLGGSLHSWQKSVDPYLTFQGPAL